MWNGKILQFKAQSIETVEFGVISQKQVGSILKNVFGGTPPKHTGSTRRLIFPQHVLDRMKHIYEMNIEIKVDFETHETLGLGLGLGTNGTDGTVSEGIGTDSSGFVIGENAENCKENDKNHEGSRTESNNNDIKKASDISLHSQNVSQVSQVSKVVKPLQSPIPTF